MSSNNPWAEQSSDNHNNMQIRNSNVAGQVQSRENPWQLGGGEHGSATSYQPQNDGWNQNQYAPPPGPPPRSSVAPVDETAKFVSESERGEQREAMEQFETRNAQSQSSSDRNIEILSREFSGTGIDSSLIAAIYVDSQDMGASREMLTELAEQMKAERK